MKQSKTKAYDTVAKVLRVDEKTAYVHIDGGADETPAQMAINCKTGDTVKIRVSGGKAWVTGNITAPPTDDSAAEAAQRVANAVAKSYGEFAGLTVENFKAVNADIENLNTKKLDVESANIKFANIDFSNIGKAAMEYFYAQSGLIKDVVVGDQKITGHLIGVTISGDLIEGNTVKAEKLVVLGEDGLYYKLNVNALGEAVASSDAKYQNGLDGSVIIAKSVTAEKVSVKDLVAFGATIGGLNITDGSLYSGVKDSINNTTQGFYVDKNGQLYLGDAEHFLRYYKAKDGTYKLAISAKSVTFGSNRNLEEAWEETKTSIESKIETVDVEYYLSTSPTSLSGGSWSTTAPTWTNGKYMWMRTKITDGTHNVTYSPDENGTCIAGATGATGSSGKGIVSIIEEYYQSTSATSLSGGSWSTVAPTWVDGKYIWTRSVITYTDSTVKRTDGICATGQKGEDGLNGTNLWINPLFDPDKPQITTLVNGVTAPNGSKVNIIKYRDHYNASTSFPVFPDHTYTIYVDRKRISGDLELHASIWYTEQSSGNAYDSYNISPRYTSTISDGWEKAVYDVTVPRGKRKGCVYFQIEQGTDGTTKWYVANISCIDVTAISEAKQEAEKTATNFMRYEEGTGLIVGDMRGDTLGQNTLLDSSGMAVRNGNSEIVRFGTAPIVITNANGDKTYEGSGSVMQSGNNIVVSTQQTKDPDDIHSGGKAALELYYDKTKDITGISLTVKGGSTYSDLYESMGTGMYVDNNHIQVVSDDLECVLGKNNILWDAHGVGYWMNAGHKFTLDGPISKQLTGAVFVWSHYNASKKTVDNWWWISFFVPKQHVTWRPGDGMLMSNPYYGLNKYIYIGDTFIRGNDNNTSNSAQNGIAVNNQSFVLRYVLGV